MLIFFAWVIWFWLLITIFSDLFRRHDIGGGTKTLWFIFVIVTPFLGVFGYLIAENKGMTERNVKAVQKAQEQSEDYIRSVSRRATRPRRSRRRSSCSTAARSTRRGWAR